MANETLPALALNLPMKDAWAWAPGSRRKAVIVSSGKKWYLALEHATGLQPGGSQEFHEEPQLLGTRVLHAVASGPGILDVRVWSP